MTTSRAQSFRGGVTRERTPSQRADATAYLFEPDAVTRALEKMPRVHTELGELSRLGVASGVFPDVRKSERQIVRVLAGAPGSAQVRDLLATLERVVAGGFRQRALYRTTSRPQFLSLLSEAFTAEHMLRQGFAVESVEDDKTNARVPELIARDGRFDVAVEVYTPRSWENLSLLADDLVDAIRHLDVPFDYRFEVSLTLLERFDQAGRLRSPHPGELSERLDAGTRGRIGEDLIAQVAPTILRGRPGPARWEEPGLNLRFTVGVDQLRASDGQGVPDRQWAVSHLSRTGHCPEGMFARLVRRRVRKKVAKAQAPSSGLAPLSTLIVDLAHSELLSELAFEHYDSRFRAILERAFDETGLGGYDIVALCDTSVPADGLRLHWLATADGAPPGLVHAMFGAGHG